MAAKFRLVPDDIGQAKYIKGLIDKDIAEGISSGELTKDLGKLHERLNWQSDWAAIVTDLGAPEVAPKAPKSDAIVSPGTKKPGGDANRNA